MFERMLQLLPTATGKRPGPSCSVCGKRLGDGGIVRVRGIAFHEHCLGYRARNVELRRGVS